jgi:2-oxoglutarate/2-oxoacid ferredoxin oxidoreductase subunit beta
MSTKQYDVTNDKSTWCPGCGNFGIQTAVKKALLRAGKAPHEVVMSTGIGCSGKISHWIRTYGVHGLHGRTLPVASGIKFANHELTVIAEGGDGDGFSEGMSHFIHACRRNQDLTYITHNNGVFGLTTGQTSATGSKGFLSSTTPYGQVENPFNPAALAISAGATFIARGYSKDAEKLADLIAAGIAHPGFAFIDVLQVCVSFHPQRGYKWYDEHTYDLADEGHDPTDKTKAISIALSDSDRLATGLIYRAESMAYESNLPELNAGALVDHNIDNLDVDPLLNGLI